MIIQELISAVVGQMNSNSDSFSFLHSDRSWQNLRADEDILPAVYLDMPVKIDTKIVAGGSIQQTYVCTLMFLYESNLDDTPETQYDTLKLAESAMNQFILMVSKDSENFDTSRNIFGQAYQVIAYPVFDRCLDGIVLPFVCTPKQRPAACVPSYSVPVGDCDPATYLVQYINETLIQSGVVASGGSITVNVPMPLYWELNYNGTDDVISIPCTVNNAGVFTSGTGTNVGTVTASTDGITYGSISYPFTAAIGTTYFFKRSTATNSGTFTLTGSYA